MESHKMFLIVTEDMYFSQTKELTQEWKEAVDEGTASVFTVEDDEFVELLPDTYFDDGWSVVEYAEE